MIEDHIDVQEIVDLMSTARSSRQIVSIYTDPTNWRTCSVGTVLAIDFVFVALHGLDPEGKPDAIVLRRLDEIFRVDIGTEYEQRIASLSVKETVNFILPDRKLLRAVLNLGKELGTMVSVWGSDNEYSADGFVETLKEEIIALVPAIDDSSKTRSVGLSVIRFDAISAVDVDIKKNS